VRILNRLDESFEAFATEPEFAVRIAPAIFGVVGKENIMNTPIRIRNGMSMPYPWRS